MSGPIYGMWKKIKRYRTIAKILRKAIDFVRHREEHKISVYANKNYRQLIDKYNDTTIFPAKAAQEPSAVKTAYPVWVCWFQGEESMPEVVKICYASLLKNADGHKINLITADNYSGFVDVPEYIREKHKKGMISHTHFSDILRMCLLSEHGGLWIDATVYVSGKIPSFDGVPFWTGKWRISRKSLLKRNSFLLYTLPDSPFALFIKECFFKYWSENDLLITYMLVDVFMDLAYDRVDAVRDLMDGVPEIRRGLYDLYQMANTEYDEDEYASLCKEICFHKLTYKEDFLKYTKSGNPTFYGHIAQEMTVKF
jgi:hypothetical protein